MMLRRTVLCIAVALLCIAMPFGTAQTSLVVQASSPIDSQEYTALEEVFVLPSSGIYEPAPSEDTVRWTWWSWSDSTGSDWPDDDAFYRAEQLNLNVSELSTPQVFKHEVDGNNAVLIEGDVQILSGEMGYWFVQFHLEITPSFNLSDDTLLYIVLTEDVSLDHHGRQGMNLVHEMRPEVGFSLQENNMTETTFSLSSDHLEAAGVDLEQAPTGWSYSLAMMNGTQSNETSVNLLWLSSGPLPSFHQYTTASQTWMPIIFLAIALVICGAVITNSREREQGIPRIKAVWSASSSTTLLVQLRAGELGFKTHDWVVEPPWKFKGRPPKPSLKAMEQREFTIQFSQWHAEDCRFEVGLDIDEMGAWRQHVWLPSAPNATEDEGSVEDEPGGASL